MFCIVYALKNTVTDKLYVGRTWQPLSRRFAESYRHSHHIHNAIKKYGRDKFYYQILIICHTQEIADHWEKHFISKFDSINNGYNLKEGGSNGKLSEQTKRKISEAQLGEKSFWYGKPMSSETKKKISISNLGINNSFYGKTHNEENLSKMRKNHKDKPLRFNQEEINSIKYKATELGISYKDIAKEYNVERRLISKVVNDTGPYKKD